MKKIMILLTLCVMLCTMLPATAAASAPEVERVRMNGGMYGQYTETFYAIPCSGWFASDEIELELSTAYIYYECNNRYGTGGAWIVPPAVEVTVCWYDFSIGQWVQEQNFDVWNDRSRTIELQQQDVVYRIDVYFWKASTVADSYVRHGILDNPHGGEVKHAYWRGNGPYVYATGGNRVVLYDNCPIANVQ